MKFYRPNIILECANSHGGDKKKFKNLVTNFSNLNYKNLHIKFQPFKYDNISTPDYEWYNVYKKLFFKESFWKKLIHKANILYSGVWLDIFDFYSIEILQKNISDIYGVKIQSSIINNKKIYEKLKMINTKKLLLIINISGFSLNEIKKIFLLYKKLNFKSIIVQYGFQSYPTRIENLNLNKIFKLKEKLKLQSISYADHIDSKDLFSSVFPIIALSKGCNYIEKHIALDGQNSKYDGMSSLNFKQTKQFIELIKNFFLSLEHKKFISIKEKFYLKASMQKPVFNKDLNKGTILKFEDIDYKRTKKSKSIVLDLNKKVNNYIINTSVKKNDLVRNDYLKKK